jgi:hypothetical protein
MGGHKKAPEGAGKKLGHGVKKRRWVVLVQGGKLSAKRFFANP